MCRIDVTTRTCMHANSHTLLAVESRQGQVIKVDEALQQISGGIDFDSQSCFGEVDLDLVRALEQTSANLGFVLAQQVFYELVAWVTGDLFRWVHETKS